jgi:hypothetical protein
VRAHDEQVVGAPARARQLFVLAFVLGHDAAVRPQADVATHGFPAVVLVRDVRIESDQAREAAAAPVRLAHDLLVVDPLEELAGERYARGLAALVGLVEEGVRNELEALLDQLVVDLTLPLDLFGSLELGGKARLELAEADVVQARGVDVVAGDTAAGLPADFDRPLDRPVGGIGVVDRDQDLSVHRRLAPWVAGCPLDPPPQPDARSSTGGLPSEPSRRSDFPSANRAAPASVAGAKASPGSKQGRRTNDVIPGPGGARKKSCETWHKEKDGPV